MSYLGLYLWTRLDAVLFVFGFAAIVTGILAMLAGCGCAATGETYGTDSDDFKNIFIVFKKFLLVCLITTAIAVLIPSKKDAALIYVVPTLAKSETIQEVAKATPEITKLGLDVLKETLEELTKSARAKQELKKGNGNGDNKEVSN